MTRKLFNTVAERQMADVVIQITAEVAGYAVSQAVIRHRNGSTIQSAVEHGVKEFCQQMIARLEQAAEIDT